MIVPFYSQIFIVFGSSRWLCDTLIVLIFSVFCSILHNHFLSGLMFILRNNLADRITNEEIM